MYTFIFQKHAVCDTISKTVLKIKYVKIQNQQYGANFSNKDEKHFDFMNKCYMNEYDRFENVFLSINHK